MASGRTVSARKESGNRWLATNGMSNVIILVIGDLLF
jgi:hypothetical protein